MYVAFISMKGVSQQLLTDIFEEGIIDLFTKYTFPNKDMNVDKIRRQPPLFPRVSEENLNAHYQRTWIKPG
jgi:hypothetical protein